MIAKLTGLPNRQLDESVRGSGSKGQSHLVLGHTASVFALADTTLESLDSVVHTVLVPTNQLLVVG